MSAAGSGAARIAHLADLHVGAPLRDLGDAAGRIDAKGLALTAFDRLVADVIASAPDAVLIAGDVFDRGVADEVSVPRVQRALDAFDAAGIRVAAIAGNHDAERLTPSGVRLSPRVAVLGPDRVGRVVWDDLGLAVVGRGIGRADETRDLAAGYPPAAGIMTVGMLHTSLTGERSRRPCAPTTTAVLDRAGYAYWALGHVHEPVAAGSTTPAWYAGGGHARRAVETGPRGWLEVTLGAEVDVRLHATAPARYEVLDAASEADLVAALAAAPEAEAVIWVLPRARAALLPAARALDPDAVVVVAP